VRKVLALIDQYAQLAAMLHSMEKDLGFRKMTKAEKAIVSAITSLQSASSADEFVASSDIQTHDLCDELAAPTFFRGLASLLDKGIIVLPAGRAKGLYRLNAGLSG
jgi:hypothetical protein